MSAGREKKKLNKIIIWKYEQGSEDSSLIITMNKQNKILHKDF